ncbi:DapH/DapD/GlmU-related protein [Kistimonas scapharcae]
MAKIKKIIAQGLFQNLRKIFYMFVSEIPIKAIINQPLQAMGKGRVLLKGDVTFGYAYSKDFYSRCGYIEARSKSAVIEINDNTFVNNSFTAIADSSSITIGKDCLIGTDVQIYDSDFHGLAPDERRSTSGESQPVHISDNVFIGNNAIILKGCRIGVNSVIAAGSLVCNDIPDNVIAGGVPCKVIRAL